MYQELKNIIFLDIETVPLKSSFGGLPESLQELWLKKAKQLGVEEELRESSFMEKAGIYAEFGKIVVISIGMFYMDKTELCFKSKSIYGNEEAKLLESFNKVLAGRPGMVLAGHNAKEFDFPYIARRMLIQGIKLPPALNISGKKPWEIPHLDTMEMWRFGDWKSYTSLALLAAVFDIPSSKDDIDGSMVADVYYEKHDLQRISDYCQKDVQLTAKIYLKLKGMPAIPESNYVFS